MSDYRDPDPLERGTRYGPPDRSRYNAAWGWVAGAVILAILVAIAFGIGQGPTQTASNDLAPPPASRTLSPPNAVLHPVDPALPGTAPPAAQPGPQPPQ